MSFYGKELLFSIWRICVAKAQAASVNRKIVRCRTITNTA